MAQTADRPTGAGSQRSAVADAIGVATQEADGTIVLALRAPGSVGDAQLRYPPSHPDYAMIKAHVGPIPSGGSVPVRPFPQGR
jgi:hypothetical protein